MQIKLFYSRVSACRAVTLDNDLYFFYSEFAIIAIVYFYSRISHTDTTVTCENMLVTDLC